MVALLYTPNSSKVLSITVITVDCSLIGMSFNSGLLNIFSNTSSLNIAIPPLHLNFGIKKEPSNFRFTFTLLYFHFLLLKSYHSEVFLLFWLKFNQFNHKRSATNPVFMRVSGFWHRVRFPYALSETLILRGFRGCLWLS